MYIDGFVLPVPTGQKAEVIDHARMVDTVFIEWGALRVVEGWGDDVPAGKDSDFARSVAATADETTVFSWIDKVTRDAATEKMRTDPRMMAQPMPFDGKKMIFGGFDPVLVLER